MKDLEGRLRAETATTSGAGVFRLLSGLKGKLLLLTVAVVMLAEVLIFIPSVANMRLRWLEDRLNAAAVSSVIIDGLELGDIPQSVMNETLMAAGVQMIALRKEGEARLLAVSATPVTVAEQFDLTHVPPLVAIRDALSVLVAGGGRSVRIYGPVGTSSMVIDLVLDETRLRDAMLVYSRNVFLLSLAISLITSTLIFFAVNRLLIRRIRRLTSSMQQFARAPHEPASIIAADAGGDELSVAARHLSAMQAELQKTLRQQKTLAELGLAVSKINHDMRNILASAQLMSDRLVETDDPMVRRFAPKLLRTLDRAVGYTRAVLAFGQTAEAEPKRRMVPLTPLIEDVRDMIGLEPSDDIEFRFIADESLKIDADGEQLFRIILNLCRNSAEALRSEAGSLARAAGERGCITVSAERQGAVAVLSIADNGPGLPAKAREHLFSAFRGAAKAGGTGLGLAIARELVMAHGGTIALVDRAEGGTQFRIEIPDRPVDLSAYLARA